MQTLIETGKRNHLSGACFFLALFCCAAAFANPAGEVVRHGDVQFVRTGDTLQVLQFTDRAIIDWDSFSIAAGQTTQFIQPGVTSAALNRVTGFSPSLINGLLRSNGRLILLNPNGVLIGANGRVDTAAFVASTLDVSNADFLAGGDFPLRGVSQAAVINLGAISAFDGEVFLVAATVQNRGQISAPNGTIGLAAGNDVLLRESGEERVWVRGASGGRKENGVVNTGTIKANIAELKASGGNIYAMAVKNEGRIAATGVTRRGGQIFLSAGGGKSRIRSTGTLIARSASGDGGSVSVKNTGGQTEIGGTVDVRGESGAGGRVVILGNIIELLPDTVILGDGDSGGGRILIGGGRRGLNPEFNNAEFVTVADGVQIDASANVAGDGGEIILFAEKVLSFGGQAAVRGGAVSGDGGFIELSGKERVNIPSLMGAADLRAASGKAGSLLFDPIDVLINQGAGGPIVGSPVSDQTVLNAGDIATFLNTNGSLEIQTGAGTGSGNITIGSEVEINWNSANDLTFTADGDFIMESASGITATGGGSLFVDAQGAIQLQRDAFVSTQAGEIFFRNVSSAVNGIWLDQNVEIRSGSGNISLIGTGATAGIRMESNSEITTDSGNMLIAGYATAGENDGISTSFSADFNSSSGGQMTFRGQGSGATGLAMKIWGIYGYGTQQVAIESFGGDADLFDVNAQSVVFHDMTGTDTNGFLIDVGYIDVVETGTGVGFVSVTGLESDVMVDGIDSRGNVTIETDQGLSVSSAIQADMDVSLTGMTVDVNAPIVAGGEVFVGEFFGEEGEITIASFGFSIDGGSGTSGFRMDVNDTITADDIVFTGGADDDVFNINAELIANTVSYMGFDGNDAVHVSGSLALEGTTFDSIEAVEGIGDSNTLIGPAIAETFTVNGPGLVEVGRMTFTSFENLLGGDGNDQFVFLNQETVDSVNGGGGVNQLTINDWDLSGPNTYLISEGLVSRNPQYIFSNIDSLNLILGPGDDTVIATQTTFDRNLDGGGGFDTLLTFPSSSLAENPLEIGGGSIFHSNFEAPTAPPPGGSPTNLGFILAPAVIIPPVLPVDPVVINSSSGSPGWGGFGPGMFGAVASANLAQAVLVSVDGSNYLILTPRSLDGGFEPASLYMIKLLRDSLAPGANSELAQAIGYLGSAFLVMPDGPFAIDLSGLPPALAAQLLAGNLSAQAALELLSALELAVVLPVTVIDGVVAIDGQPIPAGQVIILVLQERLSPAAFAELSGALDDQ